MPVESVRHIAWRQWGDLLHTADINLPPSTSYASCALTGTIGGGRSYCGIMALRTRPVRDGAEAVEKFGDLYWNWKSAIFREHLSSVTFAMTTRGVGKAVGIGRGAISGSMKVSFQAARSIG